MFMLSEGLCYIPELLTLHLWYFGIGPALQGP